MILVNISIIALVQLGNTLGNYLGNTLGITLVNEGYTRRLPWVIIGIPYISNIHLGNNKNCMKMIEIQSNHSTW